MEILSPAGGVTTTQKISSAGNLNFELPLGHRWS
jgi:hypothetical protein